MYINQNLQESKRKKFQKHFTTFHHSYKSTEMMSSEHKLGIFFKINKIDSQANALGKISRISTPDNMADQDHESIGQH